jgi:hypothetical protein
VLFQISPPGADSVDVLAVLNIFGPFLLPLVTSLLKRPGWSNTVKRWFALGVSVVTAVAFAAAQGYNVLDVSDLNMVMGNVLYVWVVAQTAFAHLWKDTKIEVRLAGQEPVAIEGAKPLP